MLGVSYISRAKYLTAFFSKYIIKYEVSKTLYKKIAKSSSILSDTIKTVNMRISICATLVRSSNVNRQQRKRLRYMFV